MVVLGPTVVANLFAGQDPVGQSVRIDGTSFEVVGVTKPKGSNGIQDQDDVVIAPITAVQDAISGYGSVSNITVQGRSAATLDAAQAEVTSILEQRHHVTDTDRTPASRSSTRARCARRPTRAPRSSPRCSARSPRSRCSSAGSAS